MLSSLRKPSVTPVTRFSTMERDIPHCWRARFDAPRGVTVTAPLSCAMVTSSVALKDSVPFGPFTAMVWPSIVALTPDGSGTGFLPIRDMEASSEHGAEHFAANVGGACMRIGHHAPGGRDDGDAETLAHLRQVLDAHV